MLALLALLAAPVAAQQPARGGPRVPPPKPSLTDFQVMNWVSLAPNGASLIRAPGTMDLTAKDDDGQITVYGHKKRPDVRPRPDVGYESLNNDAAIPQEIPIGPVSSCSNGAYNTIAGQPANGRDLMGALGGGRC